MSNFLIIAKENAKQVPTCSTLIFTIGIKA